MLSKQFKQLFSQAASRLISPGSKITRVRIWKSGYFEPDGNFQPTGLPYFFLKVFNPYRRRHINIGHVSLETKDFYASLWPESLTVLNKWKVQDGLHATLESDLRSEGREPDHEIDFSSLDLDKMQKRLADFTKENQYSMIGDSIFKPKNSASCSSLAHEVLIAGGIDKLLISDTAKNLSRKIVVEAKREEASIQPPPAEQLSEGPH